MFEKTVVLFLLITLAHCKDADPMGYLTYCPCMGRFGNQADHFLGVLAFSKALNRTLILPPWVEYRKGEIRSIQVPFDTYFNVTALEEYHRVILMEDFMNNIAGKIWSKEKRISFCYVERQSLNKNDKRKDCHAKDGNPFGPFWDTFNVNFVGSEFFKPLHFDVHHSDIAKSWGIKYSPAEWPVLAFTGAPASFPLQIENRPLHKYLVWNEKYERLAKEFIKKYLPKGSFIGVHLRNGIDWVRACEHTKTSQNLFSSPQCLGYNNEYGSLYLDLCMPAKEIMIKQVKRLIKKMKTTKKSNPIRSIFVASDNNHMIDEFNTALAKLDVSAHKLTREDPHLDLAVLALSNYFIGNCVSSYSAFVRREREVKGFPSYFWAYPKDSLIGKHDIMHEEL